MTAARRYSTWNALIKNREEKPASVHCSEGTKNEVCQLILQTSKIRTKSASRLRSRICHPNQRAADVLNITYMDIVCHGTSPEYSAERLATMG